MGENSEIAKIPKFKGMTKKGKKMSEFLPENPFFLVKNLLLFMQL